MQFVSRWQPSSVPLQGAKPQSRRYVEFTWFLHWEIGVIVGINCSGSCSTSTTAHSKRVALPSRVAYRRPHKAPRSWTYFQSLTTVLHNEMGTHIERCTLGQLIPRPAALFDRAPTLFVLWSDRTLKIGPRGVGFYATHRDQHCYMHAATQHRPLFTLMSLWPLRLTVLPDFRTASRRKIDPLGLARLPRVLPTEQPSSSQARRHDLRGLFSRSFDADSSGKWG